MRVVTGSIAHETNTFANTRTGLSEFKERGIYIGDEMFKIFEGKKALASGFIDVSKREGIELIPTIWAEPFSYGLVTSEAYDYLLGTLLDKIKAAKPFDGILLQLHGAMVTEDHDDAEGHILTEIRKIVGESVPIVATLDLHANISKLMVEKADVFVGYDTYPHVDVYERGVEAAEILVNILRGKIKPTMALFKPPMMPSPQKQKTSYPPMKTLIDMAHEIEAEDKVINVTVAGGYPFSDVEDAGMSFVITTNNDFALADQKAKQLGEVAWRIRREFLADVVPIKEALMEAMQAKEGPIILADQADNPGGGAPCDGTFILKTMLEMGVKDALLAVIRDPEAVTNAIKAGVGNTVTTIVGGKTDKLHGEPIQITGQVKIISNGRFIGKGPMARGLETNLGRTVVIDCNGIEIILTERRYAPIDLNLYYSLGINPTEKKIIVVKSAVHFRAAHEPIAKKIIEVDVPGIHGTRFAAFNYKKVRRPIFPLDVEMLGISELRKDWNP
jgi:microcystin degradation protein MlrC